jgi:hypothetical protein
MALATAAFLFGLAVWDKALAVWVLSGVAVAGILTFRRQILDALTLRRAAIAVFAFLLGALPLIIYNADSGGGTFQGNFDRDLAGIPGKGVFLIRSFAGQGLFGWMTSENWETPKPHQPQNRVEKASFAVSELAGRPRRTWFLYAFLLALLLTPLAGRAGIRLIAFGSIAFAVAWIQMAANRATGGSIHHTILLWPLPQFIVAISFSAASYRLGRAGIPAVAAATAVLAVSGALVMNEYFAQMVRFGGNKAWSDAVFPLARSLDSHRQTWIYSMDWGILDQLRLLGRGRLWLAVGTDQISKPSLTAEDRAYLQQMVSSPSNLFIAHTKEVEFFPGNSARLAQFAAGNGYRREDIGIIPDSYGRNVYEIYRFVRDANAAGVPGARNPTSGSARPSSR